MRVSELSDRSGVPLSSIKFYIREGLLPRGESTAANQAQYAKSHLERLALIRALREVCGLGIDAVGRVLSALDDPGTEEQPILLALRAMEPDAPERSAEEQAEYESALSEVTDFLDGLAWTLPGQHEEYAELLADALVNLRRLVMPGIPVDVLAP